MARVGVSLRVLTRSCGIRQNSLLQPLASLPAGAQSVPSPAILVTAARLLQPSRQKEVFSHEEPYHTAAISLAGRSTEAAVTQKPRLVIFDKYGTLINFHAVCTPWILGLAERLESATGMTLAGKIFRRLDVCMFTKKTRSGILAQGTSWQIKHELEDLLVGQGLLRRQAQYVVEDCWEDLNTDNPESVKSVADIEAIFQQLQREGIKIAVCTSDSKRVTKKTLARLNLLPYVDFLACGDDVNYESSVSRILEAMKVKPHEAVVVGDTQADMRMGLQAGVSFTIGVLSGIGTRLELAPYATHIVDSIQDSLPLILGQKPRSEVTLNAAVPEVRQVSLDETSLDTKASLVIFDKDGTLICFHSMWTPWAKSLISRLEEVTGLSLFHRVMEELGYCHKQQKWGPGIFAEGTVDQNQARIIETLKDEGLSHNEAEDALEAVWEDGDHSGKVDNLKPLDDLAVLFRNLKRSRIKIAICTADNRAPTKQFLQCHGIDKYVDMLVCGDDEDTEPKPSPHNALKICRTLGVHPSKAVIVGDTTADLGMGKSAKLGATVAVLSGVGEVKDLDAKADHIVPSIKNLLPIVLSKIKAASLMKASSSPKQVASTLTAGDIKLVKKTVNE